MAVNRLRDGGATVGGGQTDKEKEDLRRDVERMKSEAENVSCGCVGEDCERVVSRESTDVIGRCEPGIGRVESDLVRGLRSAFQVCRARARRQRRQDERTEGWIQETV